MRKCKTCQSTLRDEIDSMIMGGANWKYLESWCCDRGLVISETALRNHAKRHIKGYEPPKTNEVKDAPKPKELAKVDVEPTLIEFERYALSIGLDLTNLDRLENNIGAAQKATSQIFFRLNAIADSKLRDYELGQTKFPTEQIRALKLSYEIYSKILGIEKYINENSAIATLEIAGYKIEKEID
jgi:hypothetical protein